MCSEIDALFFEEQYHPTNSLPKTFSRFEHLPAELRNNIYEQAMSSYLAANPSIKINAHGEIVLPPLLCASKRQHAETEGYYNAWLSGAVCDKKVRIQAQIRDYDSAPLCAKLAELSKQFSVPRENLIERTKVSFIGNFHLTNILDWVDRYLDDRVTHPVFRQRKDLVASVEGFGAMEMFYGSMSVLSAVRGFELAEGNAAWRRIAVEFLENAKDLRFGDGIRGDEDVKTLSKRVFETIAFWHHGLKKEMRGGWRRSQFVDMTHVVYTFWREVVTMLTS